MRMISPMAMPTILFLIEVRIMAGARFGVKEMAIVAAA